MPAFVSPFANLAPWTFTTIDDVVIPDGLRYAGYAFRGLRATLAAGDGVQVPATGILRRATDAASRVFVEVQVIPFRIRRVAIAIPGGLPTFYFVFADATGLTFTDGDGALGGSSLRSATDVTIVMAGQDRAALDPALWAAQISMAIVAGEGTEQYAAALSCSSFRRIAPEVRRCVHHVLAEEGRRHWDGNHQSAALPSPIER